MFDVAVSGRKFKKAACNAGRGVIVDTVSGVAAEYAGELYLDQTIGYGPHKVMHLGIGTLREGLNAALSGRKDIWKAAASGGMGALIAEISAEALTGDIQTQTSELRAQGLSDHQIKMVLLSRANFNADMARLAAGSLAFIAQQDINAALSSAGNALENNYFQTAIPALIRAAAAVPRLYSALKATLFATTAIEAAVLTNEAINNVNDSSAETERRNSPSSSNATSTGNPPADWMTPYLPDSSIFSTPIQESKPSIFSTPIYPEQRPSIFITPTYDGPTWQEGFTPWTGPLPQNITVPVDLPDMTVLMNKAADLVDLKKFTKRGKNGSWIDPKTKKSIVPDRGRSSGNGSHGGSWWKLLDARGKRVKTLDKDGRILRD